MRAGFLFVQKDVENVGNPACFSEKVCRNLTAYIEKALVYTIPPLWYAANARFSIFCISWNSVLLICEKHDILRINHSIYENSY